MSRLIVPITPRICSRFPKIERPRQRSGTVLIVEDNDNVRNLLQRTLEGAGFSVLPAYDGAEALRWSEQHEGAINIVVSDIVMPGLNSLELSKLIRAARAETRSLFITGFWRPLLRIARIWCRHSGKPLLPSELLRKVEELLNQGKAARGTG